MEAQKKISHRVLKILGGLLSVLLILLLGFLLILAQPQPDPKGNAAPQPLLTASPAVSIWQETELLSILDSFPSPVLSFMSGSGMIFVSGTTADAVVNGGFGRIVTLWWQTPEGDPLILQSIYPASALSLLEKGYHFSNMTGPTLFGFDSVRMENEDTVRIHAATDTGLYVVLIPKSAASRLSALSRSMQLFSLPKE